MLKALALDLHRGEDEAIAHKMRRIAHTLRCLEAGNILGGGLFRNTNISIID